MGFQIGDFRLQIETQGLLICNLQSEICNYALLRIRAITPEIIRELLQLHERRGPRRFRNVRR